MLSKHEKNLLVLGGVVGLMLWRARDGAFNTLPSQSSHYPGMLPAPQGVASLLQLLTNNMRFA